MVRDVKIVWANLRSEPTLGLFPSAVEVILGRLRLFATLWAVLFSPLRGSTVLSCAVSGGPPGGPRNNVF